MRGVGSAATPSRRLTNVQRSFWLRKARKLTFRPEFGYRWRNAGEAGMGRAMSVTEATTLSSRELALAAHAWPFEEARKVLARLERFAAAGKAKDCVLFETGYGPSGLPHIGTFGEVARTTWVRHAFEQMSDVKTRLIAFSDDMDGLRKVPGNIPNPHLLEANLGKPLTDVP